MESSAIATLFLPQPGYARTTGIVQRAALENRPFIHVAAEAGLLDPARVPETLEDCSRGPLPPAATGQRRLPCSAPVPHVSATREARAEGIVPVPAQPAGAVNPCPAGYGRNNRRMLPTIVVPRTSATNRLPIAESIPRRRPVPSPPRACIAARRAAVPVPHGDRSSRPGGMIVAFRNVPSGSPSPENITNST